MSDATRIDVLEISGSLPLKSFNTATLWAAQELAADGMRIRAPSGLSGLMAPPEKALHTSSPDLGS